ncbi:F0F1 ATP synthase subunit B [Singulisphaera sp. PoT]|uniref:F0F1 ATP synthase subunit B n=1 Tax=Singulisphaera sp. PoT TaxID=3411797 RepID=UPI003BF49BC1
MPRQLIPAFGLLALVLALGAPARSAFAEAPPAKGEAEEKGHHVAVAAEKDASHEGTAPAHGAEGKPNILKSEPPLALYTIIVFLGLLFVLGKFAWGPLIEALHKREEHLEHVLLDTEKARNESERLLAEHRRQMDEAEDRARALIDDARHQARATAEEIVNKARAEAEAEHKRALRDIESARDNALSELWSKTADLAVTVAGKVLDKNLSEDDHRHLIEAAINQLPSSPAAANASGQGGHAA